MLERKHLHQVGGKMATVRSWKHYYTVLAGQLLCFFKDHHAYVENHAAAPPLALKGAKCDIAAEYTKKKNVIRLTLSDQSEYLFMTHDPVEMNQWQSKIQFHAGLHPSQQLTKYDGDTGPQNDVTVRLSGRGSDGSGDIGAVESTDQQLNLPPPTRDLSDLYTLPNRMSDHQQGQVELSAANEDQLIRDSSARKDSLADAPPLPASVPPTAAVNSSVSPAGHPVTGYQKAYPPADENLRPVPASQRAVSAAYDGGYRGNEAAVTNNQRASYLASATLPVGVSPAFDAAASGRVTTTTTTLERDSKPPKGSKPMTAAQLAGMDTEPHEKEKKKSRFSFFGSKSKKDKDGKK